MFALGNRVGSYGYQIGEHNGQREL